MDHCLRFSEMRYFQIILNTSLLKYFSCYAVGRQTIHVRRVSIKCFSEHKKFYYSQQQITQLSASMIYKSLYIYEVCESSLTTGKYKIFEQINDKWRYYKTMRSSCFIVHFIWIGWNLKQCSSKMLFNWKGGKEFLHQRIFNNKTMLNCWQLPYGFPLFPWHYNLCLYNYPFETAFYNNHLLFRY